MTDVASNSSMSRRDRLKQEREARILDAATAVFARKGFHQATIREIAALADVADGTIYNYFHNKFDLLVAIMARATELDQLPGELVQALHGDVRVFFVRTFHERMGRIQSIQDLLHAVLPEVFVNPELRQQFYRQYVLRIAALLEPYLRAQVERGHVRPVDVPLTVRLVQSMVVGLLMMRILGDETVLAGWAELPEVLATLVVDGLRPVGQD